jgi:hypothetical protein
MESVTLLSRESWIAESIFVSRQGMLVGMTIVGSILVLINWPLLVVGALGIAAVSSFNGDNSEGE